VKGLARTHFRSDTDPTQQYKLIKLVRQHIETIMRCKEHEVNDLVNVMQQNGFTVSSVSEGSILITFRCFNEQSLTNLKKLYNEKTLDRLFTETFCPEFVEEGLESLSLDISDDEFEKCEENFKHMALMTSEHRISLLETAAYRFVADNIAITGDLLDKLSLSQQHIDKVLGHSAHSVRTEMLFEIISR
jgi:hypothetical protein